MAMRPPLPPPPLSGGVPGVLQISRRGHEKREPADVELSSAECSYPQLASKG